MEGLVQEGKRRPTFRFCDDFGTEHEILLGFQGKGQKDLELNGEKITKLGIILVFSVTLSSRFSSGKGGPSDRRKWLDLLLSSRLRNIWNAYKLIIAHYGREMPCLKGWGEVEFSAFEQVLARSAVSLQSLRALAFRKLPGNWKPVIAPVR